MAAAETRRLLEQLMGEQLMSGSDQRAPQLSITDPKVCRSYLVGNCPHDLFTNTKNELGPCPKVHNEALKTEYQEADADQKRRWGFDFDYLRDMQHHIDGCNRKIDQAQRRLEKTPEEIRQTNALLKSINELTKSIDAGMLEVQIMGEEGMVNMAVQEFTKVRMKKAEKEERERELRALSDTGGPSGHQKLQVCDVCGAYLSRLDNDRRLADHFYGKMHLGYAQMRKSYESLGSRETTSVPVTDHVLDLEIGDSLMGALTPSSEYLASLRRNARSKVKRQTPYGDYVADVQENLVTLGGRVYMTRLTLSNRVYSLVIDTGSSDTWIAQAGLICKNAADQTVTTATCKFGALYNTTVSRSYRPYIPRQTFGVNYTSGEYLQGILATELLGLGDVGAGYAPRQIVNQTIGVVQQGYWNGDGSSSGLMGLAYSRLASGSSSIGYEAVIFSLFDQAYYPPVFSLALNRTLVSTATKTQPSKASGGVMAFGGLPSVNYDTNSWVQTSIIPVSASVYTYYSMRIDGFNITAPTGSVVSPQNYAASSQNIIVDSGTSLIYLPDPIADYIASLFQPAASYNPNSGLYIVNCQAVAPRVGVTVAGTTFFISTDDLMNRGSGAVGGAGTGAGTGQCVLAIQRTEGGASVLGDSWLKNVLVVFDLGGNEIRIARREVY
ncbi:splicing factor [Didymella sp. IMI 355093]|nr:splicing factor [Didymella sp. IMI 355093]